MTQSSDPSYLLAEFPSTDKPLDGHDKKDAKTTDLSVDSADAPKRPVQNGERGFIPKFMPGRLFADFAATLVPIALIAFAIAIMHVDDKDTEQEEYRNWRNAINVIASAFPIAFASIVGRMVFEAAQKGATLGLLEQLIGSRTVGSTFITQICLGKFNILGLVLLLLWAFSQLGSQAVLRTLGSKLEPVISTSSVLYFSTDAETRLPQPLANTSYTISRDLRDFGYLKSMFASLFFTSEERKTNPMDQWGNVKFPNLDINDDRWHNVTSEPSPDAYSALLGLPVTNVTTGNVTFSLESSYLYLDCWNYNQTTDSRTRFLFLNWTEPYYRRDPDTFMIMDPLPKPNGTWHGRSTQSMSTKWSIAVDRFVVPYWYNVHNLTDRLGRQPEGPDYQSDMANGHPRIFKNETDLNVKATNLLFASLFGDWIFRNGKMVLAECSVMQRYVQSRVHCSRVDKSPPQNCSVTAQRLSRTQHATEDITMLNWPIIWSRLSEMPKFIDAGYAYADIILKYISNPRLNAVKDQGIEKDIDLFNKVTAEQLSRRLGQVINTDLLLGQVYHTAMQVNAGFNFSMTVPAERTNLVEVYTIHWSWMILFLASSLILLASGAVSIAFAHLAIGPEVLGYASTVVHSSKYVELPAEAGKKEAFDIVKMMGQRRLRYGYVDSVAVDEQPMVAFGLENETRDIHKR